MTSTHLVGPSDSFSMTRVSRLSFVLRPVSSCFEVTGGWSLAESASFRTTAHQVGTSDAHVSRAVRSCDSDVKVYEGSEFCAGPHAQYTQPKENSSDEEPEDREFTDMCTAVTATPLPDGFAQKWI